MNDTPLCASKRTGRSLWQQYRIYGHRLELQSWVLLHTVVIPANEIQADDGAIGYRKSSVSLLSEIWRQAGENLYGWGTRFIWKLLL